MSLLPESWFLDPDWCSLLGLMFASRIFLVVAILLKPTNNVRLWRMDGHDKTGQDVVLCGWWSSGTSIRMLGEFQSKLTSLKKRNTWTWTKLNIKQSPLLVQPSIHPSICLSVRSSVCLFSMELIESFFVHWLVHWSSCRRSNAIHFDCCPKF